MDSDVDPEKFSGLPEHTDDESVVPDVHVNPPTMMISNPPFTPVDDEQQNELECPDMNVPQPDSSETIFTSTINTDVSTSSSHMTDRQIASVAAWVESTTAEVVSPTIERSPSLPSTLIEPQLSRSRRNSIVSTICDQQISILSDTLTSHQLSFTNEMQRSLSVPNTDQLYPKDPSELIIPINQDNEDDEDDDTQMQFLPVPESEDSEVDKKTEKAPLPEPQPEPVPVKLESQSSTSRGASKVSSNVSFHASVSFEPSLKPLLPTRRRRNSGSLSKPKPPVLQRSRSHIASSQPPSLHSQLLRRKFETALSMPAGADFRPGDTTRQSSNQSDSVFLSTSNTSSSRGHHFQAAPSTTSYLSSDRYPSIISDVSGLSGIESNNLDSQSAEPTRTESTTDDGIRRDRPFFLPSPTRIRSLSTSASETPSTQSISSSSDDDDDMYYSAKGIMSSDIRRGKRRVSTDKRRDVLKQLMWLLEKKTTIYARSAIGHRKSISSPRQQQRSSSNLFVEVRRLSFDENLITHPLFF